jgi:hypothetical protein
LAWDKNLRVTLQKGTSLPPRCHQNNTLLVLTQKMEAHVAKFVLAILSVGFVFGFAGGYGVRAAISYHRRSLAERGRLFFK